MNFGCVQKKAVGKDADILLLDARAAEVRLVYSK
jgi:hypothetical protein